MLWWFVVVRVYEKRPSNGGDEHLEEVPGYNLHDMMLLLLLLTMRYLLLRLLYYVRRI